MLFLGKLTLSPYSEKRRVPAEPLKVDPRYKLRRGLGYEFLAIKDIDLL